MSDPIKIPHPDPERVVKRAMFLAWQAAGRPRGKGVQQNRPEATEDEVWANIQTRGDYPADPDRDQPGEVYADYVFGRMLKAGFRWEPGAVVVDTGPATKDYQAWAGTYPDHESLVKVAVASLAEKGA